MSAPTDDPIEFGPPQIGVWMDLRNPPQWERDWAEHYQYNLELAEHADRIGIDRIAVAEHHFFPDGYIPQPLTFAAGIAARTRQLRIGTCIMIPGLRPSVDVAEQAAIVDLISGGRLELGFGAGYRLTEFEAYGVEFAQRWTRFEQSVRDLHQFWQPGGITPLPIQRPIPIIGGFSGPRGMRLTGRLGLPLMSLRDECEPYLLGLEEGGHALATARQEGYLHAILVDDPDQARSALGRHVENFWNVYLREDSVGTTQAGRQSDIDEILAVGPRYPAGFALLSVDQATELVATVCDGRPVTNVCFWATVPGAPESVAYRNLELITQLQAALRQRPRAPWKPRFTDEMRAAARSRGTSGRRSVFT